jgi:hypothetical protein
MAEVIILDAEKHQVVLTDVEDATLVFRILEEALFEEVELEYDLKNVVSLGETHIRYIGMQTEEGW